MKKLILIALLFIGFNSYAQFDKGGVITLSNVSVFALDTSARNIIHIIEDERVAGGGAVFSNGEKQYVNYIVTNLKSIGVWYKCKAIYGFVGGTAASNKWNWKDMRDLDAAFRLTFDGGGWVHSNNGAKPNGTTSYGSTYLIPSVSLTINSTHLSFYSGTNSSSPTVAEISHGTNSYFSLGIGYGFLATSTQYAFGNRLSFNASNSLGYYLGTRLSSTDHRFYKNSIMVAQNTSLSSDVFINNSIGMRISSASGNFSDREARFISVGSGLTDLQSTQMSQIITYAQSMRANF
jgi:hypothetical protein